MFFHPFISSRDVFSIVVHHKYSNTIYKESDFKMHMFVNQTFAIDVLDGCVWAQSSQQRTHTSHITHRSSGQRVWKSNSWNTIYIFIPNCIEAKNFFHHHDRPGSPFEICIQHGLLQSMVNGESSPVGCSIAIHRKKRAPFRSGACDTEHTPFVWMLFEHPTM